MDAEEQTPEGSGHGRRRLAAALGVVALAIPGGALVSSALASDGSPATPNQQQSQDVVVGPGTAQVQDRDADGRDCPEKDGGSGSGASGDDSGTDAAPPAV